MVSRRVAVVQGTAPGHRRWLDGAGTNDLATYSTITGRMRDQHLDLVVWPEHAVDGEHEPLLRRRLASIAAEVGEPLLVGARRPVAEGGVRDAAYLLDASGALREMSDEADPVPVAAIPATTVDHVGTAHVAGTAPRPLPTPAFLVGATSRRELVRPEVARDLVGQGADVLVSLGGDAAASSTHGYTTTRDLSLAVFRAVETRRYLVRAAGAGPSGFIDPTGELYAVIEEGRTGATVGRVSPRADLTPYVRFGDVWLLVVGLAVGVTMLAPPPRGLA
jgi:apolipoprotein N-acyltransferase